MLRIAAALLILTATSLSWSRQQGSDSFLRAMEMVPIEALGYPNIILTFADNHAALTSRGLTIPSSWADMEANHHPRWTLFGLAPGAAADMTMNLMQGAPGYKETVGFDYFELAQTVEVGQHPGLGLVLLGAIDPAAIHAAFAAQGYEVREADGTATLLCPPAGCDSGRDVNLAQRNLSNPFGGNLGRWQPVAVAEGVVLQAADDQFLRLFVATHGGVAPALAEVPEVRAIASALADYPFVNTVMLLNADMFAGVDERTVLGSAPDADRVQLEALLMQLEAMPVPPYALAAFAATADADGEYGLVLLIYPDAEAAATAAASLDARLATLASLFQPDLTYAEQYEVVGTLEPATVVRDEDSGMYVVVVRLAGEPAPLETERGADVLTGRQYQRFFTSVVRSEAIWLVYGSGH